MRISTSMIFDSAVNSMQTQTSSLLQNQQRIASGQRMLTPSDDPTAASQALQVTQAKQLNAQYGTNQDSARSTLNMVDGQLQSVGDLVQYVRDRALQAGNATMNASDLKSMAADIRSQFDNLLGLSNASDGTDQFLFSGYQGAPPLANNSTRPFTGAIPSASTGGAAATYNGDDGQRALQVSSSRQMPVSDPGSRLFMGNPYAQTTAAGSNSAYIANTGIATSVQAPGALTGHAYQINLTYATGAYQVTDGTLTAPDNLVASGTFTSGQPIQFDGISVTLTGAGVAPATGTDSFSVQAGTPGLFDTLANMVNTLENPGAAAPNTAAHSTFKTQIGNALGNLDKALDNVLNIRASVGSRLNELDALSTVNANMGLQYTQMLSNLQDLDYPKAISELSKQQVGLQAAQKSFMQISSLSLFNYIQ